MATTNDVAGWMVAQVTESGSLYQATAARNIKNTFGEEFTYRNKNHNLAIKEEVLDAFNEQTENNVVWVKKDRRWRLRRDTDKPGRQQ